MNGIDTIYLEKDASGGWLFGKHPNRATFFGDGIFETMVLVNGSIRFGNYHLERITNGLRVLQLQAKEQQLFASFEQTLRDTVGSDGIWRVRWNLYREGLGKYTPDRSGTRESVYLQPFLPAPSVKRTAATSQSIRLYPNPWANCKTLNTLPYVMANMERKSRGLDEILLTDGEGHLSEAGAANLFWVKDGIFFTPSLSHNCIAGVGRRAVIDHLRKIGLPLREGSYLPQDLTQADQVFTTNVTGLSYIEQIGDSRYPTDPLPAIDPLFAIP